MHFFTCLSIQVYHFFGFENNNTYYERWLGIAKHSTPVTLFVMRLNIFSHPFSTLLHSWMVEGQYSVLFTCVSLSLKCRQDSDSDLPIFSNKIWATNLVYKILTEYTSNNYIILKHVFVWSKLTLSFRFCSHFALISEIVCIFWLF